MIHGNSWHLVGPAAAAPSVGGMKIARRQAARWSHAPLHTQLKRRHHRPRRLGYRLAWVSLAAIVILLLEVL